MFAIKTQDGRYYNGRAGLAWLSNTKAEAFTYSLEGAQRKAAMFNQATCLHGHKFEVEVV